MVAFILTALAVNLAGAQVQIATRNGQVVGILSEPRVQRELKLTDEQLREAAKADESFRTRVQENSKTLLTPGLDPVKARERFVANSKASADLYKKDLDSFLDPGQRKRLRQITIQRLQAEAFVDPGLLDELRLTGEQRSMIEEVRRFSRDAMRRATALRPIDERGREDREAANSAARAVARDHLDMVLCLLTEEQKKGWEELQGPHFDPE
jgi:hypothetical protein